MCKAFESSSRDENEVLGYYGVPLSAISQCRDLAVQNQTIRSDFGSIRKSFFNICRGEIINAMFTALGYSSTCGLPKAGFFRRIEKELLCLFSASSNRHYLIRPRMNLKACPRSSISRMRITTLSMLEMQRPIESHLKTPARVGLRRKWILGRKKQVGISQV